MITVEVEVPSLGRRYDFELEETVPVEILIREMSEVISQREHCHYVAESGIMGLYVQEYQHKLGPGSTLEQNGIRSGQRLLLV